MMGPEYPEYRDWGDSALAIYIIQPSTLRPAAPHYSSINHESHHWHFQARGRKVVAVSTIYNVHSTQCTVSQCQLSGQRNWRGSNITVYWVHCGNAEGGRRVGDDPGQVSWVSPVSRWRHKHPVVDTPPSLTSTHTPAATHISGVKYSVVKSPS